MTAETRCDHLIQTWPVRPPTRPRRARIEIPGRDCDGNCGFFCEFAGPRRGANPFAKSPLSSEISPAQMKTGSLLIRSGEDSYYAEAPRLGADYDLTVSGPTIRGRVTQIFQNNTENWVEAVYVYPLPEDGAVDIAEDGDRRAHRDRRDQGAADRARDLRTGQGLRPQDHSDRAGAAEHLHQFGRQYRARRNHPGAARISGAGEADPPAPFRCASRWWSGPRYNPKPIVQTVDLQSRRARLGPDHRSGAGSRPHRAAGAGPARECADQSGADQRCGCRPASRSPR